MLEENVCLCYASLLNVSHAFLAFKVLRSFDQFCNFALEDAIERRFQVSENEKITYYSDIKLGGVFLVRGDSVVILGEVSNTGEQENSGLKEVSLEEFSRIKQEIENAGGHQPSLTWDME